MNNRGCKQLYLRRKERILSSCKIWPLSITQEKYFVQSNTACQKNLFNKQQIWVQLWSIARAIFKNRLWIVFEWNQKKIKLTDIKELVTPKTTQRAQVTLTVTYNCILPNIKQVIQNHWSVLKTKGSGGNFFSWTNYCSLQKTKPWNNSQEEIPSKTIII